MRNCLRKINLLIIDKPGVSGTVRRFLERNIDAFGVVVFVVEPIDEVRTRVLFSLVFQHHSMLLGSLWALWVIILNDFVHMFFLSDYHFTSRT